MLVNTKMTLSLQWILSCLLLMFWVCHAFLSFHCSLVVTYWERADIVLLVCEVLLCFVTFPCDVLGQVGNLIESIPDLCLLSYFKEKKIIIY